MDGKALASVFVYIMHTLNFQKLPSSKGFHSSDFRTNLKVILFPYENFHEIKKK
jgi:hypothetical protein